MSAISAPPLQAWPAQTRPGPAAAIEIEGLAKHYPKVKAVDGISLTVAKGEIFSLLGHNGAGKPWPIAFAVLAGWSILGYGLLLRSLARREA